jgi:site-specific DNA-methyltransferase (adenine-specific)
MIDTNQIYNMDCIKGMSLIPKNSIDLIVTDPPFAIDFKTTRSNYNRKDSNVIDGYSDIAVTDYPKFTIGWMSQAFRVLAKHGSMFVFSGWNNLKDILVASDEIGFTTVNHIIWKYQFGVVCKRRFVTSHYHCLFLCKDDAKRTFFNNSRYNKEDKTENGGSMRYKDMEDVWTINREYWRETEKTPNKLPAELIEKILMYTSQVNDVVLDPFSGSGQVAIVSKTLNRKFIGFEIIENYYNFSQKRLNKII